MSGPYAPTDLTHSDPATRPVPFASITEDDGWSVPDGLAAEVAKQPETPPVVDLDTPTTTDALQQDASPAEYPPGSPRLRPYLRLPRRERAEFFRKLEPIQKLMTDNLPKQGENVGGDRAARMYDALAQVEDFLRPLAEDPAAFDAWLTGPGAEDVVFVRFFSAYFAGAQLGEAASSSS